MSHGVDREEEELLDPVERKVPLYLRVELYIPLILIAGISLAVLLYARGMYGVAGWQFGPTSETTPKDQSLVGAFVEPKPAPVVLYASPTTKAYLAKVSASHDVLLRQWREYLKVHKRAFKEVDNPAGLADIGNAVVVVPSGLALDEAERKALAAHHNKGGSILATNAFGARDGTGNWVGWGLMEELFGAKAVDEVEPDAEKNFLVTAANVPITAGLPDGTRFWVGKTPEARLRFEGGQPAARFLDWSRTPDGKGASVVFGEKNKGRWVLYGFSENAWDVAPTPVRTLTDGALDWLQRQPKAVLASWPSGFRAAHVLTMNVDDQVENALNFASSLDALKMRGTFFVVGEAGAQSPGVMKSIAAAHEIAFHGDTYKGFRDQARADQSSRITGKDKLAQVPAMKRITGFRAPGENYDARTEEVLQASGFHYHAVDANRTEARLPFFAKANKAPPVNDLVVLPRTQADDVAYLQRRDAALNDTIALMKSELDMVMEEGGLGMLSVHSRNYAKDSLMAQAVPAYLLALAERRNNVWIATGEEVAQWWRKREQVKVAISTIGQRYELEISNIGDNSVEGATAIVYHPRASSLTIAATKAWMPEATVRRIDDASSKVVFGSLGRGHYAYKVVFE